MEGAEDGAGDVGAFFPAGCPDLVHVGHDLVGFGLFVGWGKVSGGRNGAFSLREVAVVALELELLGEFFHVAQVVAEPVLRDIEVAGLHCFA